MKNQTNKHDHRFLFTVSKATYMGRTKATALYWGKRGQSVKHVCLCLARRGWGFAQTRSTSGEMTRSHRFLLAGQTALVWEWGSAHFTSYALHHCVRTRTRKQAFVERHGQNEDEQDAKEGSGGSGEVGGFSLNAKVKQLRYWLKSKILINNLSGLGRGKGKERKERKKKNTMTLHKTTQGTQLSLCLWSGATAGTPTTSVTFSS